VALLTEEGALACRIVEDAGTRFRFHWASSRDGASELLSRRPFPVAVVDCRVYEGAPRPWIAQMGAYLADTTTIVVAGDGWLCNSRELISAVGVLHVGFCPSELRELMDRAALLRETRARLGVRGSVRRVLVVDPFPPDAYLIRDILEDAGLADSTEIRATVGAAVDRLEQDEFSVVISDLSLPDARGLDAVIRLHAAAPHVPLIVMSDVKDEAMVACATRFGADAYLAKSETNSAALICSVRSATERKAREADLEQRAARDPLTGMANRTALQARLRTLAEVAKRTAEPLLVVVLDLDGFKAVNDSLGHTAGDDVLIEVARRIESVLRATDFAARLGGDEFVILAPRATNAAALVERLLSALDVAIPTPGGTMRVTASVGHASYPADGDTVEKTLALADRNMYGTKHSKIPADSDRAPKAAGG
jgi:diguanylate cyclase (GGDEF)-like protein